MALALTLLAFSAMASVPELDKGFMVMDGNKAINVDVGHDLRLISMTLTATASETSSWASSVRANFESIRTLERTPIRSSTVSSISSLAIKKLASRVGDASVLFRRLRT